MIGRAGRPQYESKAHAIIMTEFSHVSYYQNIEAVPIILRSHYLSNIENDILNELAIGIVRSKIQCVDFLKQSFLCARLRNNHITLERLLQKTTNFKGKISESNCIEKLNDFVSYLVGCAFQKLKELGLFEQQSETAPIETEDLEGWEDTYPEKIGIDSL